MDPKILGVKLSLKIRDKFSFLTSSEKKFITSKVSCIGISGYSGAGATPNDKNNPDIIKESIYPYSLSNHTHEKEINKHCYSEVYFSPHVADFFRGILITSHFSLMALEMLGVRCTVVE